MKLPLLTRYADIVRYDRARDVAAALDWRAYPARRDLAEYATVEAAAQAIAASVVGDGLAAAYLAGYGLALAAQAWRDWPSEPRRAALIQAGESLRRARPFDRQLAHMLDQGLARADAAIISGSDARLALLEYVDQHLNRADRVAERCGRIGADLLDERDLVLAHGFAGPAWNWLLALAHGEQGKQIGLTITTPPAQPDAARLAADLAAELHVPTIHLPAAAPARAFMDRSYNLMIIGADWIAMDGGAAGPSAAAAYAAQARRQGIPCYVLGYDGPDPGCPTTGDLISRLGEQASAVPPEHISAIITSRGIYRPEMIARYLGDGDAPLDVIRLIQ